MRGRSERIAFAASFVEIYHFRNVYAGTTFMFPILGRLVEDPPSYKGQPS